MSNFTDDITINIMPKIMEMFSDSAGPMSYPYQIANHLTICSTFGKYLPLIKAVVS